MSSDIILKVQKIYSPSLGVLPHAALRLTNGMITAIYEQQQALPSDVEVKNFPHGLVFPGFIEPHCHITACGEGYGPIGRDHNEYAEPLTPHLHIRDAINLDTAELEYARREGIMLAGVLPGSANLMGGMGVLLKTTCPSLVIEEALVKENLGLKMALGENPKRNFSAKHKFSSRMGAAAHLHQYFQEVINYQEDKEAPRSTYYETGRRLLAREFPARIHAHQANDIQTALRLAASFGFDVVLEHCTEGHLIVDYLQKQKVPVVIGPLLSPATKIETQHRSVETVRILSQAGILTAITTDAPVLNIAMLRILVGLVIRSGMDEMAALQTITTNAAAICGIADTYGDLRVDMPAHLVIWEGHPLHDIQARVLWMIDGENWWEQGSKLCSLLEVC